MKKQALQLVIHLSQSFFSIVLALLLIQPLNALYASQESSVQTTTCCTEALTLQDRALRALLENYLPEYKAWTLEKLEQWLTTPIVTGKHTIAPHALLEKCCYRLTNIAGPCLIPLELCDTECKLTPNGRYLLIAQHGSSYIVDRHDGTPQFTLAAGHSYLGLTMMDQRMYLAASEQGSHKLELYSFDCESEQPVIQRTDLILDHEPSAVLYLDQDRYIGVCREGEDSLGHLDVYKKNRTGQFMQLSNASINQFKEYCPQTKAVLQDARRAVIFDTIREEWVEISPQEPNFCLNFHSLANGLLLLRNGIFNPTTRTYLWTKRKDETLNYTPSPCKKAALIIRQRKARQADPGNVEYAIFSAAEKRVSPVQKHATRPELFCPKSLYFHDAKTKLSYIACPNAKRVYALSNKTKSVNPFKYFQFASPSHDWCRLCIEEDIKDLKTGVTFSGYCARSHQDIAGHYTTLKQRKKIRLYRIIRSGQFLPLVSALANTNFTPQALPNVTRLTQSCLETLSKYDRPGFLDFLAGKAPQIHAALTQN